MLRTTALVCLGLIFAAPLAAQSLRVEGRITVSAVQGGFAVNGGGGIRARGMWCAASRYATRVLGAGQTQRIYVANGSNLNIGQFTMDPRGLTPSSAIFLSKSIRTPGANLSVAHSQEFCIDFRTRDGW